jgi:hypothetical protein
MMMVVLKLGPCLMVMVMMMVLVLIMMVMFMMGNDEAVWACSR